LNDYVQEFHKQQDLLAQAKNHYRHCSTGITEKSQQLAHLTAELSNIKEEMEETGQNVTDGGLNFDFFQINFN
jgi:estrogen-related receptor beta like 1